MFESSVIFNYFQTNATVAVEATTFESSVIFNYFQTGAYGRKPTYSFESSVIFNYFQTFYITICLLTCLRVVLSLITFKHLL